MCDQNFSADALVSKIGAILGGFGERLRDAPPVHLLQALGNLAALAWPLVAGIAVIAIVFGVVAFLRRPHRQPRRRNTRRSRRRVRR